MIELFKETWASIPLDAKIGAVAGMVIMACWWVAIRLEQTFEAYESAIEQEAQRADA